MNCEHCGDNVDDKTVLETEQGTEVYCSEECIEEVFFG